MSDTMSTQVIEDCQRSRARKRMLWGVALVAVGSGFLADRLGWIDLSSVLGPQYTWWHYWPLFIVLGGVIRVLSAVRARQVLRGVLQAALGFWVFACLEHWGGLSFHNSWPVLLIGLGAQILMGGRRRYRRQCHGASS